jgi:hypothetical protein
LDDGAEPRAWNNAVSKGAKTDIKSLVSRALKHIEKFFGRLAFRGKYEGHLSEIKSSADRLFSSCWEPHDVFDTAAATNLDIRSNAATLEFQASAEKKSMLDAELKTHASNFADHLLGCKPEDVTCFIHKAAIFLQDERYGRFPGARERVKEVLELLESKIGNLPEGKQLAWNGVKEKLVEEKLKEACSRALEQLNADMTRLFKSHFTRIGSLFKTSNPLGRYNQAMLKACEFAENEARFQDLDFLDPAKRTLERKAEDLGKKLISSLNKDAIITMINDFKLIKNDENNLCTILFAALIVREIKKKSEIPAIRKAAQHYLDSANERIDACNNSAGPISSDVSGTGSYSPAQ